MYEFFMYSFKVYMCAEFHDFTQKIKEIMSETGKIRFLEVKNLKS